MMKKRNAPYLSTVVAAAAIASAGPAFGQELPIPSSRNATVISLEHSPADSAEVDYVKANFNFGLYAWPSFSVTTLTPDLGWRVPLAEADAGLQAFKTQVDAYVRAALAKGVRLHLVLTSGLARGLGVYREAKVEDVRNCQWYSDNNIASEAQITDAAAMETFVFGTFSRYARKLRANLEAKARTSQAYLSGLMAEHPETLVAVSGWGEAELNYRRLNNAIPVQEFFCDYSPFAVLEFRDWILHAGEYDDAGGKYAGQGYAQGGSRYQGADGLARFNADFGTNFTTWNLRHFHWSLSDDYDPIPEDAANNDPRRIPFASYVQGGMMPASGPNFIAGGFDPPRAIAHGTKWWDLWNFFRQTMVANFVRDAAVWASEAGIPAERWFSHQIPADCLFGTSPADPYANGRYNTSASPIWTADIQPFGSPGATIYDNKFPGWFARTTDNALPVMAAMSPVWAIMEYDAEGYPPAFSVQQSDPDFILAQYRRVYEAGPYLVNFWRWTESPPEHQIKGMNKEIALRNFIQLIRDKARSRDLGVVFTPPRVVGFRGEFLAAGPAVELRLTGKIWEGQPWEWTTWGDFRHFEIYKGTAPGFPADAAHLAGATRDDVFRDPAVAAGTVYYYKVRAVNAANVPGPLSAEIKVPGYALVLSAGVGGTTDPEPGTYMREPGTALSVRAVPAEKFAFSHWSGDASGTDPAIQVTLNATKILRANFQRAGLFPPVDFSGRKAVNRSLSQEQVVLVLSWRANPQNPPIAKYRLYLVEGSGRRLLAEIDPASTEYTRRGVAKDKEYVFGLAAVGADGRESPMATVSVK